MEVHAHPGALAGESKSPKISLEEYSAPSRGSKSSVREKPGMLSEVIYVPAITLWTLTFLVRRYLIASPVIPPSSSSLTAPRLLTSRTTSSAPSFLKGTKERSLSVVSMILSSMVLSSSETLGSWSF